MPTGRPNPPLSMELIEQMSRKEGRCRVWTGPRSEGGYAWWKYQGQWTYVYRWLWEQTNGPIPAGMTIDHTCHNPARCKRAKQCPHRRCITLEHLELVPRGVNSLRGGGPLAQKARQTRCIRGHKLSGSNLYVTPDGRRQCRACRSGYMAEYYQEHRATWNKKD